jgi:RNA polymerase sigma factor (sigma-70 family)
MDDCTPPVFLAQLREGRTERAWATFLGAYAGHLSKVIRRFAPDEDARSDCFVFVCEHLVAQDYRRLRKFDPAGAARFTTWLYSVTYNLCLDWRRTQRPRLHLVSIDELPSGSPTLVSEASFARDPAGQVAEQIDHARLAQALGRMDADSRLMLRFRYEKDLTLAEVARLMGLSNAQAADRRLRAIVARLQEELAGLDAENRRWRACHASEARDLAADEGGS